MLKKLEGLLENFIFNSRWLLTPIYIVLVLTLIIIGVKTVQEFLYEITHIFERFAARKCLRMSIFKRFF